MSVEDDKRAEDDEPAEHQQLPEDRQLPEDEQPPEGGGLFRRLAGDGSAVAGPFSAVVDIFGSQSQRRAQEEIQRLRTAGARNPSATDPPDDSDEPGENRVAAPGRRGTPFSGRIVIRPRN